MSNHRHVATNVGIYIYFFFFVRSCDERKRFFQAPPSLSLCPRPFDAFASYFMLDSTALKAFCSDTRRKKSPAACGLVTPQKSWFLPCSTVHALLYPSLPRAELVNRESPCVFVTLCPLTNGWKNARGRCEFPEFDSSQEMGPFQSLSVFVSLEVARGIRRTMSG